VPIYDYVCASCRQKTEVIHGIDAPGPRFCPACGAEGTMRKTFATPTVHFKGSGWAKKDRSSSSRARARAGAGSSSSEGGESPAGAAKTAKGPRESASTDAGGEAGGSSRSGETGKPSKRAGTAASEEA
jgi:putative FmdB family regulatory protein